MDFALIPQTYDKVVSALTGNGEICTTLGPSGFHVPPDSQRDVAHQTQHFVWAGRRRSGPDHQLIDFGSVWREIEVNGDRRIPFDWRQEILPESGAVYTTLLHDSVKEETRSFVALSDNVFFADTVLSNAGTESCEVVFHLHYRFGDPDAELQLNENVGCVDIAYKLEQHLGDIQFGVVTIGENQQCNVAADARGAGAVARFILDPGESGLITSWIHFSDRMHYEFPIGVDELDAVSERHEAAWADFWNRSEVKTGDELVDDFRLMSLYTLRCQATPWSIPASLSGPYWGGGAFHDELYPFHGLLSSNHPNLAERICYFRLATLPKARERAIARGALYPWSSTENGDERDPNGLWLTERFHLGQFAICIRQLWHTERNRSELEDLYPVLLDLARYFELNMLEQWTGSSWKPFDASSAVCAGRMRTKPCVDFDESVGKVANGPFTISAAIACFEAAAEAASCLDCDRERADRWTRLACELRKYLPVSGDRSTYAIPDGKPLHYSIIGPIFPFGVDCGSACALNSLAFVHEAFRSTLGWKSGASKAFEESNWMWTAGHLGIAHAMVGNADLAWEAIRNGPLSAGPLLSPNEHRNAMGDIQVPWFTTGCGAWLHALNSLFVQVDEDGTRILPAIPVSMANARFRNLRGEHGVLVSGEFGGGKLVSLVAKAPRKLNWRCRIPERYQSIAVFAGRTVCCEKGWVHLEIELGMEETPLLKASPPA